MKKIAIFGDSHVQYFRLTPKVHYLSSEFKKLNIELYILHGGTLKGIGRQNSTLGINDKLVSFSLQAHLYDAVLFSFGQVDIELGFFYRKIVKQDELITYENFIVELIEIYMKTIKDLKLETKVIVKGINFPVIKFKPVAVEYVNRIIVENISLTDEKLLMKEKLKRIYPSYTERVNIHKQFNTMLKKACIENNIKYFDINDYLSSWLGKEVDEKFIPAWNDHHVIDSLEMRSLHLHYLMEHL